MRVLSVIITPPGVALGGAIHAGLTLARAISAHCDMEVAIIRNTCRSFNDDGLQVHHCRALSVLGPFVKVLPERFRAPLYVSAIPKLLNRGNYDVVHLHNPIPAIALRQVVTVANAMRIPTVMSTHGFFELANAELSFGLDRVWKRWAWNLAVDSPWRSAVSRVTRFVYSSAGELSILDALGVNSKRHHQIAAGIAPWFLEKPAEADRGALGAKLELCKDHGPVLLFMGAHTQCKGIDTLLDALNLLDTPCVAIIGGPVRAGPEHNALLARVPDPVTGKRVLFTDRLTRDEVRCLYRLGDLFVFPTRMDTFPLVVLEAMAASLPVVSTTVGGIPDQVDTTCATLVPPGDAVRLAVAIEDMLASPESMRRMGRKGQERVRSLFTTDAAVMRILDVYRFAIRDFMPPGASDRPATGLPS